MVWNRCCGAWVEVAEVGRMGASVIVSTEEKRTDVVEFGRMS